MFKFLERTTRLLKNEPDFDARSVAYTTAAAALGLLGDNLHHTVWYGSTKYGRPRRDSDVDIFVVTEKPEKHCGEHREFQKAIAEKAISMGVPTRILHLNVVNEEVFSAYPSVHPAISAAFWRGEWISPSKKQD